MYNEGQEQMSFVTQKNIFPAEGKAYIFLMIQNTVYCISQQIVYLRNIV
jgi:hypothetical protein